MFFLLTITSRLRVNYYFKQTWEIHFNEEVSLNTSSNKELMTQIAGFVLSVWPGKDSQRILRQKPEIFGSPQRPRRHFIDIWVSKKAAYVTSPVSNYGQQTRRHLSERLWLDYRAFDLTLSGCLDGCVIL